VGGLLSSPRRRRRIAAGIVFAAVVGTVAFVMVNWSNTAHVEKEHFTNEPAQIDALPVKAPFAQARREGVLVTARRFLRTAVVRENIDDSWELTAPTLKAGYTRERWATEDIPVQPYPVDAAKWKVDYSWVDVVGLKVALFPKHGTKVPAAVFDMQLHAFGSGKNRRWLVDSWTPASYVGIPSAPLGASSSLREVPVKQVLPTKWLFAPLAIFALLVLVPATMALRGWWRSRRALRAYKSGLG
jgi:hypothetical protein